MSVLQLSERAEEDYLGKFRESAKREKKSRKAFRELRENREKAEKEARENKRLLEDED